MAGVFACRSQLRMVYIQQIYGLKRVMKLASQPYTNSTTGLESPLSLPYLVNFRASDAIDCTATNMFIPNQPAASKLNMEIGLRCRGHMSPEASFPVGSTRAPQLPSVTLNG